jgi:hypothetical protein
MIAISTEAITHDYTKDGYLMVLVHKVAPHFLTRGWAVHTSSMMWYLYNLHMIHYTTTPRLVMDDLTLKVDIATDDLSLKSYSDRLMQSVQVLSLNIFSDKQHFYR